MKDITQTKAMGSAEWGMLALLSLVWGGSFFFYKVLVQALPPFTVVLGRMAVAAIALHTGGHPGRRAALPGLRIRRGRTVRGYHQHGIADPPAAYAEIHAL